MRPQVLISLCSFPLAIKSTAIVGKADNNNCLESCQGDRHKRLDDHCYYWSTIQRNQEKVELICNNMKSKNATGHLAAVTSLDIHKSLMEEVLKIEDENYRTFWIGGSDKESEGIWKWADGSDWNFTKWAKELVANSNGEKYLLEQPTNLRNQDCLVIYHPGHAKTGWDDHDCYHYHPYFCIWKICPGDK